MELDKFIVEVHVNWNSVWMNVSKHSLDFGCSLRLVGSGGLLARSLARLPILIERFLLIRQIHISRCHSCVRVCAHTEHFTIMTT